MFNLTHKISFSILLVLNTLILMVAAGCSSSTHSGAENDDTQYYTAVGYTRHRADGNRIVCGSGVLPYKEPVDIELSGVPQWIAAVPYQKGSLWAVVLTDGAVQAYSVVNRNVIAVDITPDKVIPGTPPLLVLTSEGAPRLITGIQDAASPLTSPVVLDIFEGRYAYVEMNGDLVITDGFTNSRVNVDALPDTPVLTDGSGKILVLSNPTDSYNHGVTGDGVEAAGISLVDIDPIPRILRTITIPEPHVIEGNSLMWTDITGDGKREIIVTISDSDQGAWLNVYTEEGKLVAEGPPIGRGFRWRHQIAAAPFNGIGDIEIVVVKTPHIGGIIEFYHVSDNSLNIGATIGGFTSHKNGSRNLDMAAVGDFDGDGLNELLLPNQALTDLGAIRRTHEGAEADWNVTVGGSITTNLAAVTLIDGSIGVGIGHAGQILRLWVP